MKSDNCSLIRSRSNLFIDAEYYVKDAKLRKKMINEQLKLLL